MKTPIHLTINYTVDGKNVTHSFVTEFDPELTYQGSGKREEQLPAFVSTIVSGIKAKTQSSNQHAK